MARIIPLLVALLLAVVWLATSTAVQDRPAHAEAGNATPQSVERTAGNAVPAANDNLTIDCSIPASVICEIADPDGIDHVEVQLETALGTVSVVDQDYACQSEVTVSWDPIVPNGNILVEECEGTQATHAVLFDGLIHTSQGSAGLALTGAALRVGPLGTSSADGVRIDVSDLDFWEATLADLDGNVDRLHLRATGKEDGGAQRILLDVTTSQAGGRTSLVIDNMGLAPNGYRVVVLRDTTPVAVSESEGSEMLTIELDGTAARWCNPFVGCRFEFWRRNRQMEESFAFSEVLPITIGGQRIEGNRLEIIPLGQKKPVDQFGEAILMAAGSGALMVAHEQTTMPPVRFAGLDHLPIGNAAVTVRGEQLVIDELGSSGKDGMATDLGGPAIEWGMTFAPDMTSGLAASLNLVAIGGLAGEPPGPAATLKLATTEAGYLSIAADFATSTHILEVYRDDTRVARRDGVPSDLVQPSHVVGIICDEYDNLVVCCNDQQTVCTKFAPRFKQNNDGTCEWEQSFEAPVPVTVGGETVFGNRIRLYESPALPDHHHEMEAFTQMRILGTNVGVIEVDDEFVTPRSDHRTAALPVVLSGEGGGGLPDLRPGPSLPDGIVEGLPGTGYCVHPGGGASTQIRMTVRNQGTVATGPTTTAVDFFELGTVQVPTPALDSGQAIDLTVNIPPGCYTPPASSFVCAFEVTVDASNTVAEGIEANNTAESSCLAPAG